MGNTDMVIFQGDFGGVFIDSWSTGYVKPGPDSQQDWSEEKKELGSDQVWHFIVTRDLITNDE